MPELPEVETVKNTLKRRVLNKKIIDVKIYWDNIIDGDIKSFKDNILNEKIIDIHRKGKWLIFELNNYYLLSHLRMEGKYFLKDSNDFKEKHEHVIFTFSDGSDMRYHDTRKFGRMRLISKDDNLNKYLNIGLEPWDEKLTTKYLEEKLSKNKEIKTLLLDQTIIAGIGNIYADEILFLSKITPFKKGKDLNNKELNLIIENSKNVLEKAIAAGGTTIRTYTSSLGVTGRFQNELYVHTKDKCLVCDSKIIKSQIGGRGTYFCPKCQKVNSKYYE